MSKLEFVPCLTSSAGSALSYIDWQALGVKTASCHLDALLVKPGIDVLHQVKSIAEFMHWPQRLIVNAANLTLDSSGLFRVRSAYDGRLITISLDELLTLIIHLSPDVLVLPVGAMSRALERFPASIQLIETLTEWRYFVTRELSIFAQKPLNTSKMNWFESNTPADDACNGLVYTANGIIQITNLDKAMVFTPLEGSCNCPTCLAGFTWAYLHHLFTNTPGLCQRLLIQHNVGFVVQTVERFN